MSTIKSSDEHLTLNADGVSKDIKFQANGVEKASISSAGAFTSTTIDATKLTGDLPAISGANLTGVGVAGISSSADATAMTIDSNEHVGIGITPKIISGGSKYLTVGTQTAGQAGFLELVGNRTANAGQDTAIMKFINNTTEIAEIGAYDNGSTNGGDLKFRTSSGGTSATAMIINSNGYLTMPNQPSCSVARSSGQGSGSIEWNHVNYNTGNHFSTSTYRFTAPVAGKYLVNLFGMSNSSNTTMDIEVKVNGNGNNILVPYESANGAALHQVSGSNIFSLSANDYLTVHVGTGSWYGGSAGRHNGFSVHLLA